MIIRGCEIEGATLNARAPYDFNNALKMGDGSSVQVVNVTHNAIFDFSGGSFTANIWIKPIIITGGIADWRTIFGKLDASIYSTYTGWAMNVSTGSGGTLGWDSGAMLSAQIKFYIGDQVGGGNNSIAISGPISGLMNKWHMLTGVYDRTNLKMLGYFNGRKYSELQLTVEPSFNNTDSLFFNRWRNSGSAITPGLRLDDAALWTRVLSPAEITEMYGINGAGGTIPNDYIAYWPFNDTSGATVTESVAGRNGTISATPYNWENHYA